jgi:predicted membrane-bound spermidine synthase/Na+-translocating ferredoxin:NAD+ oxidoreductase RnfG subunit
MKLARSLLIFSYGLFTIAAQALLFREFITTFEGNDISVGIFFASWFLWVGLGAIVVYRAHIIAEKLLKNIELLFLSYLPAFILQLILIIQARELAGIESYALWSVWAILIVSIIVNAPVSIITGMLFPTACRWVEKDQKLPVSQVYIIEAAGSFVGGLGVTALLALGMNSARIFFILAIFVSLSAALNKLQTVSQYSDTPLIKSSRVKAGLMFLIPICLLLSLFVRVDTSLIRHLRVEKWSKMLPVGSFAGSFQTAQAEYLYGIYQSQWVVMSQGSVIETLPDDSAAGRIAAIGLCQKPDSTKVLVVGSGLGLCQQFLRLPQIQTISWAHCDGEYVQKIDRVIPSEFKIIDDRLHRQQGDIRSLLAEEKKAFDIVILNLPDATSSALNRYYTLEFYRQVKEALKPNGLFQVRVAGGENIMGTELINLGASTKLTLEKVFSQLVITPGEDTWFIASAPAGREQGLTGDPAILRDRFASIEQASRVFTPQALLSVYLPDRAAAAEKNYLSADLPERLLINRDSRPLTHLYSLLLAAKQSGAPVTKLIKHLALAGPLAFVVPILVFVVLRIIYILRTAQQGNKSGFDSSFLVFSAGWVAIGVVIVLMYLYQTRFGSLYLYIGFVSSMFMVGLTIGAALTRYLLASVKKVQPEILLFAVIFVHSLILCTIAFWPAEELTHLTFGVAFVLCGLCAGCYFPIAARQLADSAFEAGRAGSKLETADHIGASVGGLLTSLALVPVLGARITLFGFILLILVNVPPAMLRIYKAERVCSFDTIAFRLRKLGYVLFGVGVSIVLCSNLLAEAGARLRPSLPQQSAQALAGELHLEQESTVLSDNARKINYFRVSDANDKLNGYIFSSEDLAPDVRGFGGRMNLAVYVDDPGGKLINFHIIRSNETPAYLELLGKWRSSLSERQLFKPEPFADVHAVTGATVSSEAILSALQTSARRFATQILGRAVEAGPEEKTHRAAYLPDNHGIYLIGAFVLALIVIYRGGFWSRLIVLLFNLVLGGIILNTQYSSEQIATLLSVHTPALKLTGAFLLVIGVPLLVIIFGNIYCGYICPFGAAQELLGYVLPGRFKQPIQAEAMRKARFVKYVVLLVLIIVFFFSRNRTTLAADPLISIFNPSTLSFDRYPLLAGRFSIYDFQSAILLIVVTVLIGSIFYGRFWCRYLCPAGAFLSLLNNVAILKQYLPVKRFGRCEFGLTAKDKMDCIHCDRCRFVRRQKADVRRQKADVRWQGFCLLFSVLCLLFFVSAVSLSRFMQVVPMGSDYSAALAPSGGQPRDVDMQRIRTLLEQKRLSDREAEFYKKVE